MAKKRRKTRRKPKITLFNIIVYLLGLVFSLFLVSGLSKVLNIGVSGWWQFGIGITGLIIMALIGWRKLG